MKQRHIVIAHNNCYLCKVEIKALVCPVSLSANIGLTSSFHYSAVKSLKGLIMYLLQFQDSLSLSCSGSNTEIHEIHTVTA